MGGLRLRRSRSDQHDHQYGERKTMNGQPHRGSRPSP
jgi:hypothetical protein